MLSSRHFFAAVLVAAVASQAAASLNPVFKTSVKIEKAAVAKIADNFPGSKGPALLVSTFGVELLGGLPSYAIKNLEFLLTGISDYQEVFEIEKSQKWTNYIGMAPESVGKNLVLTAGGFLIPIGGISTGKVCLFDVTDPKNVIKTTVSTDKKGWFYHQATWHDMNGDGRLDIVAARATAPKNPAGEMVWFEQPATGALSNATHEAVWPVHVSANGPDVGFILEDLDGDGKVEMVATQFFSAHVLAVYSCPLVQWGMCQPGDVVRTVIDDTNGPFFTVQRIDLNGDGKKDLLVTNNQDDKGTDGKGSVFAYEQPSSIDGLWTRHVLATGYVPIPSKLPSPGAHSKGSPGSAKAFEVKAGAGDKPRILVSGDDGGFVAVLTAASEDSSSWEYTQEFLCNSTGTIGTPDVGDVDGDGLADIFVPFYSENKVEMYTYAEAAAPAGPAAMCQQCLLKQDPVHLSPAYAWCYIDSKCHVVNDPFNPCAADQCTSAAKTSKCTCGSCNDAGCHK